MELTFLTKQVDLVLFGHVHNYERTCSVYKSKCLAMPRKNRKGIDTYDHSNYTAPVQAIIGMAGFKLDNFTQQVIRHQISTLSLKLLSYNNDVFL